MSVRMRQEVECRIALTVIRSALAAGYDVVVNDGEEDVVRSRDPKVIAEAMMSTDEDVLAFVTGVGRHTATAGWVHLVYGNDGHDVMSDWSSNPATEAVLKDAEALAETLSEGEHYSDASKVMKETFPAFFG